MYSAFDSFCKVPTWDTTHPADAERLRLALLEVVHLPGFSPEAMGAYIEKHHGQPIWPKSPAELRRVIDRLVAKAMAEQGRHRQRR
ncbi:MAG: hypothetical protein QOG72_712 [Sphingomonadales bacterium]|jgi:hypothetical protein|nr:hypothetical protein [Sphingomonadales bacterium]